MDPTKCRVTTPPPAPPIEKDRCYHGTLLLPDATLLSPGGGEYKPNGGSQENASADSHWDAQVFQPPYLFKGYRPVISNARATVIAVVEFPLDYTVDAGGDIIKLSLIRHGSVTHSMNQSQGFARVLSPTDGSASEGFVAEP